MSTITSPRELYLALHANAGSAVFPDVLARWIDESADTLRETLAPLSVHGGWRRVEYAWGDLLEQAYALSRVSDLLLLGFQPGLPAEVETPWAHQLHLPDFRRDYLTSTACHFNIDAPTRIDEHRDSRLTPSELRDLLRNRCAVRPLAHVPESEQPWAGCWQLSLPRVRPAVGERDQVVAQ